MPCSKPAFEVYHQPDESTKDWSLIGYCAISGKYSPMFWSILVPSSSGSNDSRAQCTHIHYIIILSSMVRSSKQSPPFRFSYQNFVCISHISCVCHMPFIFHSLWISNINMRQGLKNLKLLDMRFSLSSYHFLCLMSRYFSWQPIPKSCPSLLCPYGCKTKFNIHVEHKVKL